MVEALADRVVVVADGRVAHQGSAAALLADDEAVTALLGVGTRLGSAS